MNINNKYKSSFFFKLIILIIILGRLTSAFGSLDEGFHLSIAGKEKGKPISLGSEISVSVSWDVLLPDIFFYLDECSLEHGPVRVSMVKGYDLKKLKFNMKGFQFFNIKFRLMLFKSSFCEKDG